MLLAPGRQFPPGFYSPFLLRCGMKNLETAMTKRILIFLGIIFVVGTTVTFLSTSNEPVSIQFLGFSTNAEGKFYAEFSRTKDGDAEVWADLINLWTGTNWTMENFRKFIDQRSTPGRILVPIATTDEPRRFLFFVQERNLKDRFMQLYDRFVEPFPGTSRFGKSYHLTNDVNVPQ